MNRRAMIGTGLAIAPGAALAAVLPRTPDTRPPFHLQQLSDHRWRFRSWQWCDDAWRPIIGMIAVDGNAVTVSADPDPRDLPALHAALGEISRGRTGSSAR